MERKFLEELGLDKEAVDKIMAQHGKDIEAHKAAAIKALAESDAYLFGDTNTTPATVNTGGNHTENNDTGSDPFVAAAMKGAGLSTGKEGKKWLIL